MAIGSLIIKAYTGASDRDLVRMITENPYYQYFLGIPSFTHEAPFGHATLSLFRRVAKKEYFAFAKTKRRTKKQIRAMIRKQLGYVARDIRYLEEYMGQGYAMRAKDIPFFLTILELYRQQKYMFDNKTHSVEHRIVSISQPFVRPIVRGKARSNVEFGEKIQVSVDERGWGRVEHRSFEPFNEGRCLQEALLRYRERTGAFPARVLADRIYRTSENFFKNESAVKSLSYDDPSLPFRSLLLSRS